MLALDEEDCCDWLDDWAPCELLDELDGVLVDDELELLDELDDEEDEDEELDWDWLCEELWLVVSQPESITALSSVATSVA